MTTRYEDLQKMGFEDKTWRYDLFDYKINLPTTTAEFFLRCASTKRNVRPHYSVDVRIRPHKM